MPRRATTEPGLPRFGLHVSAEGGPQRALERALDLRCEAFQLFTRNPRMWRLTPLRDEDVLSFRLARSQQRIGPVIVHTMYLINLASPDTDLRERGIAAIAEDLVRADRLGCEYVVTHVGAMRELSPSAARRRVVAALNNVLARTRGVAPLLLLENSAGSGRVIGSSFAELVRMADDVREPDRVGYAVDSAHVFQAGVDVRTRAGIDAALEPIACGPGLERLRVVHLNDSKTRLGSNHDRHEHIGRGYIGRVGIAEWVMHPVLRPLPMILETPIYQDGDDRRNLSRVRRIARKALGGGP